MRAQTIFCPATIPGSTSSAPVALANGSCTNGQDGAFSGAALASQALSGLSETTTQVTTKEIVKSVAERRDQERERCPAGFSRVDGTCQPKKRPMAEPARAVAPARREAEAAPKIAKKPKAAAVSRREAPVARREAKGAPIIKEPLPPAVLIEPVRYGTWTQVFGEYEKRDAAGPGILNCCTTGRSQSLRLMGFSPRSRLASKAGRARLASCGALISPPGLFCLQAMG